MRANVLASRRSWLERRIEVQGDQSLLLTSRSVEVFHDIINVEGEDSPPKKQRQWLNGGPSCAIDEPVDNFRLNLRFIQKSISTSQRRGCSRPSQVAEIDSKLLGTTKEFTAVVSAVERYTSGGSSSGP